MTSDIRGRSKWTVEQEYHLICFYQHNELLWDPADEDYCDEDKKEMMLSSLRVILDEEFDTLEIAEKFDDLKTTFLRHLDQQQDSMMNSTAFTSDFVHYDSLMFLCTIFHFPDDVTSMLDELYLEEPTETPGLELSGLKLVMWNVNGFKKRVEELENVMRFKEVNIALLSETHLAARHQSIALEGFTIYRTDKTDKDMACGDPPRRLLYHYTDKKGKDGIYSTGYIRSVRPHGGKGLGARMPVAVYFTELPPDSPKEDLMFNMFGTREISDDEFMEKTRYWFKFYEDELPNVRKRNTLKNRNEWVCGQDVIIKTSTRPGRYGTAIVVYDGFEHEEIELPPHLQLEVTGVLIRDTSPNIRLISAYCAPNTELLMEEIDFLLDSALPTIICGDLNAKHTSWNSPADNVKGIDLFAHSILKGFDVKGPIMMTTSSEPTTSSDVFDIVITKNLRNAVELEVLPLLTSDQNAVVVILGEEERD